MTHPERQGGLRSAVKTRLRTVPPQRPDCDDLGAEIGSQAGCARVVPNIAALPQSAVKGSSITPGEHRPNDSTRGDRVMKRTLISVLAAFGFLLGMSLPVSASLETPVRIDCSDGDSIDLSADADTLAALTSSVAAINVSDTDLTCALIQLAAPTLVFHSANQALAASSDYVIGAGTVEAGCPPDFSTTFIGSFSIKMYWKNGTLRGSGNLSVGAGQCVAAGKLSSTPTCLVSVPSPTGIGG